MKHLALLILAVMASTQLLFAQVGINTTGTAPNASAMLDVSSTTKGMLVPRMNSAQRTAISSPAIGLLVFDTDMNQFHFYNGSAWTAIPLSNLTKIQDADGNTKIEVEQIANDNLIRFSADGVEYFKMNKGTLEIFNTGNSVFVGKAAGLNEVYAGDNRNVGVGYEALKITQGSFENVGIGSRALWSQADGNYNVAIGADALRSNNGITNVGIGAFSGVSNTTGNGNVFIGFNAGGNELGSNKLYIANTNTATPLIYGDFGTNALKINGSLNINNAYTLPSVSGTAGQILQTDGAGTTTWATLSSILTETDPKVGSLSTNYLSKWNGSTLANTQVYDNSLNVGIGTTAPTAKLDVNGNLKVNTGIVVDGNAANNGTNTNTLSFGTGSGEAIGSARTVGTINQYGLDFYTNHDKQMSITHSGNVGIGTDNPQNRLDVSGGLAIGSSYSGNETAPDNGAIIEGNVGIGTTAALFPLTVLGTTNSMVGILSESENGTSVTLGNSSSSGGEWSITASGSANTEGGGHLLFQNAGGATAMMIHSNNNVGIGTTNANSRLTVGENFTSNISSIAQFNTINHEAVMFGETGNHKGLMIGFDGNDIQGRSGMDFDINDNLILNAYGGNVGIGTNAPATKLDIDGKTRTASLQITNGASDNYILKSDGDGNATWANPNTLETDPKIGSLTSNYLPKWNGTTLANTQVFDNGTNVGIGTITPSVKLDINGKTKATQLQLTTGATNNYVLKSDASGNATWTDPTHLTTILQDADGNTNIDVEKTANDDKIRFTVDGVERFSITGARFDVQSTGGSTFFGANAGASDDLTNNQNSFFGYYVGKQTTTGVDNSAFGRSALELNTTGNSNTALGYVALANLTTGSGNTAVGAYAGQNATGINNVFLGYGAGSNETGNNKLYIHNNSSATPLIYGDFSTGTLTVNGKMGIGTTTPTQAKFVVNGNASNTLSYGYLNSGGSTGTITNSTNNYSIYASDRIAATEFNAFSDRRIKQILRGSNSEEDLSTLMKIKITDYKLIDSISKGNRAYKKVIAQELAEVYPNAVATIKEVIPDIYQLATVNEDWIKFDVQNAAGYIQSGKNTIQNLKVGDKIKLIYEQTQAVVDITQVTVDGFKINTHIPNGNVFVYGREVDDFHTVDYEALSTLNISATQELLKQINDLKAQNAALKAKNEADIQNLKADIEALKAAVFKKAN